MALDQSVQELLEIGCMLRSMRDTIEMANRALPDNSQHKKANNLRLAQIQNELSAVESQREFLRISMSGVGLQAKRAAEIASFIITKIDPSEFIGEIERKQGKGEQTLRTELMNLQESAAELLAKASIIQEKLS